MPLKPVDTALTLIVGPLIDDTDFKTRETAVAYDAAGMDVDLIVEKTDGTTVKTDVTLTTAGANDWTHKGNGYYEVEITAAQNAEEGVATLVGYATGILPFRSAAYDVVPTQVYDSLVKGSDLLDVTTDSASRTASKADVSTLETRLSAARAGYLDALNGHTAQTGDSYARLGAPAGASIAADVAAAKTLTAAERNAVADAVLTRDVSNVEATANDHSLCYVVLAMSEADTTTLAGKLTVFRTDGLTQFVQKTIATDAAAEPITGVQ